jgi:hypothetical protein
MRGMEISASLVFTHPDLPQAPKPVVRPQVEVPQGPSQQNEPGVTLRPS